MKKIVFSAWVNRTSRTKKRQKKSKKRCKVHLKYIITIRIFNIAQINSNSFMLDENLYLCKKYIDIPPAQDKKKVVANSSSTIYFLFFSFSMNIKWNLLVFLFLFLTLSLLTFLQFFFFLFFITKEKKFFSFNFFLSACWSKKKHKLFRITNIFIVLNFWLWFFFIGSLFLFL